jgi:hypothetical protein
MAKMKFEQLHIVLCGGGPQRAAARRWVGIQPSRWRTGVGTPLKSDVKK